MNLIKVNRTVNGMSVMIDSKNDLAPLADYIGSHSNFEPVEIRYQMGTDTGIILVHHSGTFADGMTRELELVVKQYKNDNM